MRFTLRDVHSKCLRSSAGQSSRLLIGGSQVRVLSGVRRWRRVAAGRTEGFYGSALPPHLPR